MTIALKLLLLSNAQASARTGNATFRSLYNLPSITSQNKHMSSPSHAPFA
jgi:hypothetical protein